MNISYKFRLVKSVRPKNGAAFMHVSASNVYMATGDYPTAMGSPYTVLSCDHTTIAEAKADQFERVVDDASGQRVLHANASDLSPALVNVFPQMIVVELPKAMQRVYDLKAQSIHFRHFVCPTDENETLTIWNR